MATSAQKTRGARDRLVARLGEHPAIFFALLFGSRISGRGVRPDSDWDLGVFLDPTLTARERFELRLRLIAELEEVAPVDVTVLNDAPPLLGHRALQGELLCARDRVAYVRYFVKTFAMSEDERHYREIHRRAREERLREGRFGRP
ncbi:MAG TPA: nucleotidyltransferase domain-containing protein [Thermoanaerobaculia bacterium]|nr:nucleotidyltransferase domain-containing protein [Thermoanaerobaculia bacterium]